MIPESEVVTAILDAAESLIRTGGYTAIDHTEIACLAGVELGHVLEIFPDRAYIAASVIDRYTETTLRALGAPDDGRARPADRLEWLLRMLRRTLGEDGRLCPCTTLAGELATLPVPVAAEVRRYFEQLEYWTARVIGLGLPGGAGPETRTKALRLLATLQGAMQMARLERDPMLFDQITSGLVREALRVSPRSVGHANAERSWPSRQPIEGRLVTA